MTQQEWNTYTSAMVGADIVDQNIATRTEVPLQSIVEDKILKLDERVASKFNSMPTQDRSKEFAVRNEGILNNLKGLANYLLPQAYELEKYKYDPTTQTTALLNEDTNQPIVNGTFNKQGYFNSVSSADIDSPFSGTRVNNIDALETHVSTDPNSKYQKIKKEGGYSDAQMLEFMGNDPKAQADFQAAHPGYEFTKTGVKDYSGNRDIIQGKEYSDYMLSTGQAVPGRDATEADRLLNKQAKEQKLGNYATENGTRLMDSNAIYNQFDSDKGKHDNSILGRTANIGKAFGTAVGGQVVDLADLAVTAFGGDLGTAEEKDKYVKEFFGYDSHWDERAQAVAGQAIDRMQKFGVNTNDVGDILGTAISNPEMFGTSLGYVVPMLASGPISAIGKTAKAVEASEAALKASKLTGTALELQAASHAKLVAGAEQTMAKLSGSSIAVDAGLSIPQRAAAIKDQYTNMARATDYLSKNAGIFAFSAGKTNDDIEARIKNNEGVDDTGMLGKAGMYFGNVIYNKLDVWADMGILKSPEVLNGVKLMAKSMNAGDLVKTAEGVVKTAAYTGVNLAKEGTTEAAQEIMDIISTEYKTKTHGEDLGELLKNEQDRILLSGAMGVAGAAQFTGVNLAAVGIKETPEAFKKGIELATETPLQKDLRQLREYSTPLQDEAVTAAATGDYQTVVNKVEEAHGKLVDDLDPSATKGRTYAVLLNKAMESALRAGDSVALDNVYKTMKELHNDKNVEFDIRDVVHKDASKIAQEFVQLINSGTKDTEDVAAKFRGEVGKEAEKQISILEEVKELRKRAEIKAAKMKSVMGTDLEDSVTKEIDELNATIDGYLANPTLEKTNQQIAKLGYLILDPEKGIVSDPSRPGLAVYEEALTEQLLNPKANKSLLAKELKGTAGASTNGGSTVRLQGLTEFAKSRTDKLMPRKERSAVQTDKIMDNMLIENAQMGRVIDNVLATASGLTGKGLDADTKQSYIDELNTAKGYVETANKQLNDRKAILSTVTKPEGLAGALAFHIDAKTGSKSIQVMNKVDDKWTYTKVADVVDNKVVMLDSYPAPVFESDIETGVKSEEVNTQIKPKFDEFAEVDSIISEFDELIKIPTQSDGAWDHDTITTNADKLSKLIDAKVKYTYTKDGSVLESTGTIIGKGNKKGTVKLAVGSKGTEINVNPYDLKSIKLYNQPTIKQDTQVKVDNTIPEGKTQKALINWVNSRLNEGETIDTLINDIIPKAAFPDNIKQKLVDYLNTSKSANKQSEDINDSATEVVQSNNPQKLMGNASINTSIKDTDYYQEKVVGRSNKAMNQKETVEEPAPVVDEVMTKDKFKDEYVRRVKKIIKDKAGKPEELTQEEEQLLANAAKDGILQQANKELANEINDIPATKIMRNDSIIDKTPNKEDMEYEASQKMTKVTKEVIEPTIPVNEGPLEAVRAKVRQFDKVLSETIKNVPDMLVKQHVKDYYNKKLAELQADKSKLDDMLNRYEALITKRQDKTYSKENGVVLSALKMTMDKLLTKMIDAVRRLKNLLKGKNVEYNKLETELKELLGMINSIEKDYMTERKTTIGKVKSIDEKLYGKPVVEVGEKRVVAEKRISEKTGKEVSQQTAINDAVNALADEKIVELRDELKSTEKGKTSLGAKLLGRLLTNYPMQSAIHDIIKRTNDSVFGQIKGNTFADTKLLLDTLPKGFKDFFTSKDGSKELLEDFDTMKIYLDKTTIGAITLLTKSNDNRRVYNTSYNKSNIDKYGLIMKNVTSMKDGIEKISNFPVDIIELIGTVKDGKLELDEQTQNILKFYSAKLLTDTQKMVGLILSMDESEMGQVLGIYDADEQLQVKQDARDGYVNSASVRGDIGQEVYQALGIKFNSTTPEFTEESFKTALGVLVQAITVENGSVEMKSIKSTKNRNLIKTVWENVPAERNSLIRAMSKLQYMNENRSRPLPSTKKPADRNNRTVMNTQNPIDAKSNEFINKQEKIAYRISPKLKKWLELDETDALKAMGYIDVENADLHASEIDAVLARNDKLVREWNILKTFANGVSDKKFYLNWGQTVSGRFTILNDINYQESKLHREFVVAEGSTIEVDPKSEDGRQMLEASILQGLDMDPDKLSAKTASEKFNKLFKVTDKGIEVTEDGAIKEAYDAMRENKFNTNAMAEVFADSEGHHGLSSIELLVEWDKAIRSGEKIKTHANLEIDAITSGMILTLLQIGSDEAVALAEKGGIYTKEGKEARTAYVKKWLDDDVEFTPGALIEAGKKHAAEIEAKIKTAEGAELTALRKELENDAVFKDLYSTIGVAMIGEVQAYEKKLKDKDNKTDAEVQQLAMLEQIGELNLKNIRSIAKSPVMVFIYGATITSIKKKLTYSLGVDTLVKAMKTASKLVKEGKDATKELEFIKQFEPAKGWSYTDGLGGKIDKPVEQWKQLLHTDITSDVIESIDKVINATFGTAIETAFESRLGFVNKNRDAIKTVEILMFEAYQIRLSDAVTELLDSKYGKGKHKGETYKISKEELQDINAKLTEQGYGHNIVWNDTDGSVINQTLNKTGEKGGNYSARVQVGDTKVGGQIKESKPVVNTGAAPTISIHAIDGRMMLDVLNRKVKGYTGGNVYDAVVLSLNKAMLNDTSDTYNTNMIETGFSRSILADQLTTLENMLSTMTDEQKKLMFTNIGLRPEGTLREDYTKEVNRLKLGTGKMLELLEIAEMVNAERLANSANGYSVGHLFQMGAGIVDVEASEIRAKELPAIDTIKRLLENKHAQDRKVTEKEFGVKADYVFNTNDIAKGETQIQSKANIVQVSTGEYIKLADKLWDSLSSKDIVAIIGEYIVPEKADNKSRAYSKVINGILKSNAGIVAAGMDEQLENSGRTLVDGIWVKEIKVEEQQKQEVDIIQPSEVFTNNINKNMKC